MFAAAPVYVVEEFLGSLYRGTTAFSWSLYNSFFVAGLVEESFKLLVLLSYPFQHKAFDEEMDGVIYGVSASIGFSVIENILYSFIYYAPSGLEIANARGIMCVPGHAAWGALLGYYAARGKLRGRALAGTLSGLSVAVLLHGLYDFFLFLGNSMDLITYLFLLLPASALVVIVSWVWVFRLTKELQIYQAIVGFRTQPVAACRPNVQLPQDKATEGRTAVGAVLAGIGILILLGMAAGFLTGVFRDPKETEYLICAVGLGVVPAVVGMILLRLGHRAHEV